MKNTLSEQQKEEYIALLVKMGLQQEENEEAEALASMSEAEMPEIDPERSAKIYADFLKKREREDKALAKADKPKRQGTRMLMRIAAGLMIAVLWGGSIAVACNETLRVRVMKLLTSFQQDDSHIRLIDDEQASFEVPVEWEGRYYPSYIPERMQIVWAGERSVIYRGEGEERITISEYEKDSDMWLDTGSDSSQTIIINGEKQKLYYKQYEDGRLRRSLVIELEQSFFTLVATDIDELELIKMANSIKEIP